MSDTKHTPKYSVAFGGDSNGFRYAVVSDGEPSHIATIEIEAEIDPDKPCAARDTAHLFAAAPALVEALEDARAGLEVAINTIERDAPQADWSRSTPRVALEEVNKALSTARA